MANDDTISIVPSMADYREDERVIKRQDFPPAEAPDVSFAVRTPKFNEPVRPIFDPEVGMVIGYRTFGSVWKVYDIEGNFVSMGEEPLQRPWLDPTDLIGGFGSKAVMMMITRGAAKAVTKTAIRGVSAGIVGLLRRALAKLATESALNFTEKTAMHMATKGRFVPVQILQLAVKYGERTADPQNVKGAFLYTIKLTKFIGKDALGKSIHKDYTLEVVIRETDRTVLHFVYK